MSDSFWFYKKSFKVILDIILYINFQNLILYMASWIEFLVVIRPTSFFILNNYLYGGGD